ncbi:hypothetical protein [Halomonas salipaludis]|uniref:Uncharacterized protein n=1 Tax=Halomonas salipaludis TaxID=2032625 RepID=A0A2A2EQX9_9GAMM|nr:hypothetical protein [Halomonas salipaludis]PAU74884.1 hypothetical protein CK498_20195 [Halomonas salipaludis]
MKFQGAVIKEQGVTFAIVVVKKHIVDSQHQSDEAISSFMPMFPGMPVALMAQDSRGIPKYRGRRDIVNFLANVHPSQIPWQEYTYR